MERKINLIPGELKMSRQVAALIKKLNKISIVLLITSLIGATVYISGYFYFATEVKRTNQKIDDIKNEISNLEKNEQMLVFAKDRLSKIKAIDNLGTAKSSFDSFAPVINYLGSNPDVTYSEIDFDTKKVQSTFLSQNSTALSNFLKYIEESKLFPKIWATDIGYNPSSGFMSNIIFQN